MMLSNMQLKQLLTTALRRHTRAQLEYSASEIEEILALFDRTSLILPIADYKIQTSAAEKTVKLMILDTETTGLDYEKDRVIELGYVIAEVTVTGEFLGIISSYAGLTDPGIPISENAMLKHHLTDADVSGKMLDLLQINQDLETVDIVVAHNARFDRHLIEHEENLPAFKKLPWVCTLTDIDWAEKGASSVALEYLGFFSGFKYESHRALSDVMALTKICETQELFPTILREAKAIKYVAGAYNAPFDLKDALKDQEFRPYYKGSSFQAWYKLLDAESLEEQLSNLESTLELKTLRLEKLEASARYSNRELEVLDNSPNIKINDLLSDLAKPTVIEPIKAKAKRRML